MPKRILPLLLLAVLAASARAVTINPNTWFASLTQIQKNGLQWTADGETGDLSQWDNSELWITGAGTGVLQKSIVHSGKWAMKSTINAKNGEAGVRWPRRDVPGQDSLPTAAYYSTWFRYDKVLTDSWFNVMQWKHTWANYQSSDPVWTINIMKVGQQNHLWLYRHYGTNGQYDDTGTKGSGWDSKSNVPIPIGTWNHLEAYYKWANDYTGELDVYLNGQQLFARTGIRTKFDHADSAYKPVQWAINDYGENVTPSPMVIYFDDAAISSVRLGTNRTK